MGAHAQLRERGLEPDFLRVECGRTERRRQRRQWCSVRAAVLGVAAARGECAAVGVGTRCWVCATAAWGVGTLGAAAAASGTGGGEQRRGERAEVRGCRAMRRRERGGAGARARRFAWRREGRETDMRGPREG